MHETFEEFSKSYAKSQEINLCNRDTKSQSIDDCSFMLLHLQAFVSFGVKLFMSFSFTILLTTLNVLCQTLALGGPGQMLS